jgi:lymphocyte antigen 6 complex protein
MFFVPGYAMECYVCENQDDNTGKCLKTIKTCNPDEDMCLSEIKWGSKFLVGPD